MTQPATLTPRRLAATAMILLSSISFIATSNLDRFEDCDNQIDDDGDGLIDLSDSDCIFVSESRCGDFIVSVSEGEECDDGNRNAGDGCRADCRGFEQCGDGFADPILGEACDDGNTIDGDACSADCSTINSTSFTSERDINGLNPSAANVVVFGDSIVTNNGVSSRLLLIAASPDPSLCASIEASTAIDADGNSLSGFPAFFSNLFSGVVTAPVVLLSAESIGEVAPFAPLSTIQGDERAFGVSGGFIVGDGATTEVDTLFGGFNGALYLQTLVDGVSISGQYDGIQPLEFVTGETINVLLHGIFVGDHCQAISDGLPSTFGQ